MFKVIEAKPYTYKENGTTIEGRAVSVSNAFSYNDAYLVSFYGGIEEVDADTIEVVYYHNFPGGDKKFKLVLFPAEGFTQEDVQREAPQYLPRDNETGEYDVQEVDNSKGLNVYPDGGDGSNLKRHELYRVGI